MNRRHHVCGQRQVVRLVADTIVGQSEALDATLERIVLDVLDGIVGGNIDPLQRAGDDRLVNVFLIGVDADAPDAIFPGLGQHPVTAAAGDLEHDVRALRDLVGGDSRALGRIGEVVGVAVEGFDRRIHLLGRPLVAGNVVIDRRDLDAADRADRVLLLGTGIVLFQNAGDGADECASFLLFEQETLNIGVLQVVPLGIRPDPVDDRKVNVGEVAGDRSDRLGHQEADPNDQVITARGVVRQVGNVFGAHMGLGDVALDAKLILAAQAGADVAGRGSLAETDCGEMVEALVVETAGVRHQADFERLGRGTRGRAPAGRHEAGQQETDTKAKQTDG